MKQETKIRVGLYALFLACVTGIVAAPNLFTTNRKEIKFEQRKTPPSILRVYAPCYKGTCNTETYVQSRNDPTRYITLQKHLNQMPVDQRDAERSEIETLAEAYGK